MHLCLFSFIHVCMYQTCMYQTVHKKIWKVCLPVVFLREKLSTVKKLKGRICCSQGKFFKIENNSCGLKMPSF